MVVSDGTPHAPAAPVIGVALKWAPLRLAVDPLTGEPDHDPLSSGLSDADRAALETALRLAEALGGTVRAVTVGPDAAEAGLREALAVGAAEAVRVQAPEQQLAGTPDSCARTVRGLATAIRGCAYVVCGDYSADGGSGSVPGMLAAAVGAAQALGLVEVGVERATGRIVAERRLDRGLRERVRVDAPAVLSVEPAAARLRRAGLVDAIRGDRATIEVVAAPAAGHRPPAREAALRPYRPRTRVVPSPEQSLAPAERMRLLLGIDEDARESARVVTAEPAEAAREIADQLRRWGYA